MATYNSNKHHRSILLPPGLAIYPPGEKEQDHTMEASWAQVLDDIQGSPGYQLLFGPGGAATRPPRPNSGNPSTSAPASHQFGTEHSDIPATSSPTGIQVAPERSVSPASSHDSDATIKPGGVLESGGIARTPTRAEPQLDMSTSQVEKTDRSSVPQLSAYGPAFEPAAHPASFATQGLPRTRKEDRIASHAAVSTPRWYAGALRSKPENHFEPSPSYAVGVSEMGSPLKNSPVGDTMCRFHLASPAQSVAQTTLPTRGPIPIHQRRASSKFAFVPVLPSPLGPGHYTDDLGSDGSGLVTPAPKTAPLPTTRSAGRGNITATAPAPQAAVPLVWAQSTPGPGMYAPFDTRSASDPFVERSVPGPSTSAGFAPLQRSVPGPSTPAGFATLQRNIPAPNSPAGFTPLRSKAITATTPYFARPLAHTDALRHPVTGLYPHQTPVSIPPPSFAANLGVTAPQPSSMRLAARKEWFDRNTARMVATSRAFALAKEKYEASGHPSDYTAMLAAQQAMSDAWDGDRLQEERRNLTMPEGMRAMRVEHARDGMGGEKGRLLGGGMAVLERICAEVRGREGQYEMRAEELSKEEKRAVRQAAMEDVKRGVERMAGRE
ncbi:uncharacterized protein CC84DRAFT_180496 [Paraphaeosphaeria sporulosa]|uniref:Uncharacterized protein n=1 Tax=Paraphaeosphaeria sporulosa TaxID=1460663 RepID=A0A177D094_9PLEO|nr:uncharacterized protein CC84DRAFT_180496 [Paraphaeosphaeria sporulosa]OAG13115.1 hypothetical protein CC84DRAFT_180496 [Paraphaeosphaeria sporulosa]